MHTQDDRTLLNEAFSVANRAGNRITFPVAINLNAAGTAVALLAADAAGLRSISRLDANLGSAVVVSNRIVNNAAVGVGISDLRSTVSIDLPSSTFTGYTFNAPVITDTGSTQVSGTVDAATSLTVSGVTTYRATSATAPITNLNSNLTLQGVGTDRATLTSSTRVSGTNNITATDSDITTPSLDIENCRWMVQVLVPRLVGLTLM